MTATVAPPPRYTPEDLLRMPDGDRYELVDGVLVEQEMSVLSSWVGGQILSLLVQFCREHGLGWVMGADCGYQCFPGEPGKLRKPDVSFISGTRASSSLFEEGYVRIAPDLAVEVISPHDLAYEVEQKVEEYLRAGVRIVWVVNPRTHTVQVYRLDQTVARLHEEDDLDGEDILPGFRCPVREIFPPAEAAAAEPA